MSRQFWDVAAQDYYDPARHPRTEMLRRASASVLTSWFGRHPLGTGAVTLEVGSGRPLGPSLTGGPIVALDWSARMLAPIDRSGRVAYLLGDAERMAVRAAAVDAVVASLAGPFNAPPFWREARRVARRGAVVAFTGPSYRWARRDRGLSLARDGVSPTALWSFNGGPLQFSSIVMPDDQQVAMVESHGFRTLAVVVEHLDDSDVRPPGAEVSLFVFEAC